MTGRLDTGSLSGVEPESDFERFVGERLRQAGYNVSCQVGVAGYRIDIAVQHPENPKLFVLGIECDGATYHSSKFARERDRLRQEILEANGWEIYRIWSTDWFANPDLEFGRLERRIEDVLAKLPSKDDVVDSSEEGEPPYAVAVQQTQVVDPAVGQAYRAENGIARAVKVGDRVKYCNLGDDDEEHTVVLGENRGGWADRTISLNTPVAMGLLGAREGEVVTLELPRNTVRATVLRIDRADGYRPGNAAD